MVFSSVDKKAEEIRFQLISIMYHVKIWKYSSFSLAKFASIFKQFSNLIRYTIYTIFFIYSAVIVVVDATRNELCSDSEKEKSFCVWN
jgi:hypothetical protein